MPMDFPDMKSLKMAARVHKFRPKLDEEAEEQYRVALANHVAPIDRIESDEIRFGVGWDKWNESQKLESLLRGTGG